MLACDASGLVQHGSAVCIVVLVLLQLLNTGQLQQLVLEALRVPGSAGHCCKAAGGCCSSCGCMGAAVRCMVQAH